MSNRILFVIIIILLGVYFFMFIHGWVAATLIVVAAFIALIATIDGHYADEIAATTFITAVVATISLATLVTQ